MQKQIRRFSPHQNAKVFAILMAVSSLIFVVPIVTVMFFTLPAVDQHGNSLALQKYIFAAFPFVYLIVGYLTTLISCAIYNYQFRLIGGFEFEVTDQNSSFDTDGKDKEQSVAAAFTIS